MTSSFSFQVEEIYKTQVTVQEGKHGEGAWLPSLLSMCSSFFSPFLPGESPCQKKCSQICFSPSHQNSLADFQRQIGDVLDKMSSEDSPTVLVRGLPEWLNDLAPLLKERDFGLEETGYGAHFLEMCRTLQGSEYPKEYLYDTLLGILNLIILVDEEENIYSPSLTGEEKSMSDQLKRASLTSIHSSAQLVQKLLLISESIPCSQSILSENDQDRVILLWMKQIHPFLLSQMPEKKEELIRLGCDALQDPKCGLDKIIKWISDETSLIENQFTEKRIYPTLTELSEDLILLKTGREARGVGQPLSRKLIELESSGRLSTWWENRVRPTLECYAPKEELGLIAYHFSAGRNEAGLNEVSSLLFQRAQRRWRKSLCLLHSQERLDQINRQNCAQYPSWKEALEDRRSSLVRSGTCMAIYFMCGHLLKGKEGKCSIPSWAQLQERAQKEGENLIPSVWEEVDRWMDESSLGIIQRGIYRQILRLFAFVVYRIAEKSSQNILHKVHSRTADPNQWDNFVIDGVKMLTQGMALEQAGEKESGSRVLYRVIYWGIDQLITQLSPCGEISEAQKSVTQWGRSPSHCMVQKVAKWAGAEASIVVLVLTKWLMKGIFSLFSVLLKKGARHWRLSERIIDKITSVIQEKSRDSSTQYVLFRGLLGLAERAIENLDALVSDVPVPKSFKAEYDRALHGLLDIVFPLMDPGGLGWGRDLLIERVCVKSGAKALHNVRVDLEDIIFAVMDLMYHPSGGQDVLESEKSWEEVDEIRSRAEERFKELISYLVDEAVCDTVGSSPTQRSVGIDLVDWFSAQMNRKSLDSVLACTDCQMEEDEVWFEAQSEIDSLQAEEEIERESAVDEIWRKRRSALYSLMHALDRFLQIQEYYGQEGRENELQMRLVPILEKINEMTEACQDSQQDAIKLSRLIIELEGITAHSGLIEWRREQAQRRDPDNTWGHYALRGAHFVADKLLWGDQNQGLGQPHRWISSRHKKFHNK